MSMERGKHKQFTIRVRMHKTRRGNAMKISTRRKGQTAFVAENIVVDGIMDRDGAEKALRVLLGVINDAMMDDLCDEIDGTEERVAEVRERERRNTSQARLRKLEEEA